ncbi:hypothetical protein BDA96_01G028500 [Sorghum bicolor]|uniref:Uncharacterized protein n=1 Tax=Sorghum bicolor TaxID=4558 RepID=A0A921RWQ5_SORBI|nr:hypothetical protein BDA96_01G028500 [Sorghum bicolor]
MVDKTRSNCFGRCFYKNNVLDASFAKPIVWAAKNATPRRLSRPRACPSRGAVRRRKVKVSTPQDGRISRHVRLRKKLGVEICARAKLESFSSFLCTNVHINVHEL